MDLKTLINTPPWDWPSDAGKLFQNILHDSRAQKSDRLMAAELAGDSTVINDDLSDALMAIVRDAEEPEKLRARAAISLGAVLELADMDGFEDPDDVPISERTFLNIQDTLHRLYLDRATPRKYGGEFWKHRCEPPRPGARRPSWQLTPAGIETGC